MVAIDQRIGLIVLGIGESREVRLRPPNGGGDGIIHSAVDDAYLRVSPGRRPQDGQSKQH